MNFRNFWSTDFRSSVVVFLVALPLCLGIALASGAPLFSGLLAGIIGGIVVGALSGSSVSVSGPAAGLSTIVAASIIDLGSFEIFLFSVALAGIIQLILGFAKAGAIGHFFPISVIKGMLSAIGIILILKQIPHAVGYDVDFEGDESFFQSDGRNTFSEILASWDFLSPGAVVISLLSDFYFNSMG
jgi:MFS superfamily sulfate permease-like transporter